MSEITKTNKDEEAVKTPNHNHPLYPRNVVTCCRGCGKGSGDPCDGLYCPLCDISFHRKCIESLPEIHYPFHSRHPLQLYTRYRDDDTCRLCSNKLETVFMYRCYICNFNVDLDCVQNPPLLATDLPDIHEHKLILRPRKVVFTCDACGENGDRSPYVCSQCDFMIHKDCLDLPRVIRINRHQHRISHVYFLESGYWTCRVCRKEIDKKCGAYSCTVCNRYGVHSKCATSKDVWDGIELKGTSDKDESDGIILPYKVINNEEINHICHEKHNLRLITHGVVGDENMCCQACALSVDSYPIYKCMQCDDFIIHEKCVNLPKRKQHVLHNHQLTLDADFNVAFRELFRCSACYRFSSGFNYQCCDTKLDIQCASISEPFSTENHPYDLYHTSREKKKCIGCGEESSFTLSCPVCGFVVDFKCATLPYTTIHEYDDHPLSLSRSRTSGGGSSWCEICEKEIDLKTYVYQCEACNSTFHTSCALGDFKYVKTGCVYVYQTSDFKLKAIYNDHMARLSCTACGLRCKGKYLMLIKENGTAYACSTSCFLILM